MASLRRDEFAPGKSDRHEMCLGHAKSERGALLKLVVFRHPSTEFQDI